MDEIIHHLAFFISRLWQIHVFGEGNTGTTAVFLRNLLLNENHPLHNRILHISGTFKEPEKVIRVLKEQLSMEEETVRKKVEKVSSIERIKTNVDKTIGDAIREYALDGVKVDEDYRRYYPYGSLASKVMGFTGGDNQGIIGLEAKISEKI